jgi:hypothetical protein
LAVAQVSHGLFPFHLLLYAPLIIIHKRFVLVDDKEEEL